MNAHTAISLIGLVLNIVGTLIIAVSLNPYLSMIDSSIKALEIFKNTVSSGGDVLNISGMDKHRKTTNSRGRLLTTWGFVFLLIGFVFQAIGIFV